MKEAERLERDYYHGKSWSSLWARRHCHRGTSPTDRRFDTPSRAGAARPGNGSDQVAQSPESAITVLTVMSASHHRVVAPLADGRGSGGFTACCRGEVSSVGNQARLLSVAVWVDAPDGQLYGGKGL